MSRLIVFWLCAAATAVPCNQMHAADIDMKHAHIEAACQYHDDSTISMDVEKSLHYVDTVLPNIPPEESKYLKAESDATRELSEDARQKHVSTALIDKR